MVALVVLVVRNGSGRCSALSGRSLGKEQVLRFALDDTSFVRSDESGVTAAWVR
jgi:hypothetical protein